MLISYNSIKKVCFGFLVALISIAIINRVIYKSFGFPEKIAGVVIYPLIQISDTVSSKIKKIFSKKDLNNRNALLDLQNQCIELHAENTALKSILSRVDATHDIEEFSNRYALYTGLTCKIIMKQKTAQEHSFIINRGARDGISTSMVAVYKNNIVGKVSEVFPYHSKIIFITDSSSNIPAIVFNTQAKGIVSGVNDDTLLLNYVNHLETVTIGDKVLSSGQGMIYPEGFCIGIIISDNITDLCHNIIIKPLITLEELSFCTLLDRSFLTNY